MIDIEEIRALVPRARQLVEGVPAHIPSSRPAPGSWSINEIFMHVAVVNRLYAGAIAAAIDGGRAQEMLAGGPFRLPWLERQFIRYLEPPYRMRSKAPAAFTPPSGLETESVVADWESTHQQLIKLATEAAGLDLARIRFASPAASWLRLTLGGAFPIAAAHSRRHLWQAEQFKKRLVASAVGQDS